MTKRMLIDATHAEETRVVVLDGNRLEDYDVETSTKRQLKGNIYLAKVIRVEPSLQAAFVEYGGGRHGFLAFSEIHPDYYQIPIADRQRLLELQAQEAREEEEAEDAAAGAEPFHPSHAGSSESGRAATAPEEPAEPAAKDAAEVAVESPQATEKSQAPEAPEPTQPANGPPLPERPEPAPLASAAEANSEQPWSGDTPETASASHPAQPALIERDEKFGPIEENFSEAEATPSETLEEAESEAEAPDADSPPADMPPPETIGGDSDAADSAEEARQRRMSRFLRNYRIQEVIKRRQIMLVQVVKEERGTKGAALTTYISLAGRYCVLMPNSPRGGGISRKITSATDRKRLKEIVAELDIPPGMGLIVRTAGANRPKAEIKRDCEYLMRLWDDIREHTLRSVAPALIYEEASLIKRAIRDVYSRDIDEVVIDGEEGWKAAHDFMRMLMPSHARKVQLWRSSGGQPLFSKYQVEAQLDAMLLPTVQLRSGGYIVINQTEALVAIDVNSGRSTRERGIEETALRTNLEAAEEVARQLRLRDLAGLIVIDFIDMESKKHNAMVEKRLKEALKSDRARIQVGHISHFGLLEMSRQRLRPSLAETSFSPCPHCGGTGHVRSVESSAIHVLRAVEEEGAKGRASLIRVHVASAVALYLLNHKRDRLSDIERRYAMAVHFEPDDSLVPPQIRIERLKPQVSESGRPTSERPVQAPAAPAAPPPALTEEGEAEEAAEEIGEETGKDEARADEVLTASEEAERRRRRRRRRRGGRREHAAEAGAPHAATEPAEGAVLPGQEEAEPEAGAETEAEAEAEEMPLDPSEAEQPSVNVEVSDEEAHPRGRRRGRRGGRRRRGHGPGLAGEEALPAAASPEAAAPASAHEGHMPLAYAGPTPADPFGGVAFDLFDMMEAAEAAAVSVAPPAETPAPATPDETARAPLIVEPLPEPEVQAAAAAPSPEPAPVTEAALQPPPEPAPASAEAAAAEPVAEAPPAPVIRPIVIGQDEVPAMPRKRGWWRR